MAAAKHPGGRPPKFTSKEQIQVLIDKYFEDCKGHQYVDPKTGEPVYDKNGYPVIVDSEIPTVTGLALGLGFTNRMSLLNYQGKAEFRDTIILAKTRIEKYVETRLFDKDGANGAKFSLQNNFKGWDVDKQKAEESSGSSAIKIICDIPRDVPAKVEPEPETETEKTEDTKTDGK